MDNIKIFIIVQFLFFLLQFIHAFKLENYQYFEMVWASIFIIVFFGLFGTILTNDFTFQTLNDAVLFSAIFVLWYYCTKKITNAINTDPNGVIHYF